MVGAFNLYYVLLRKTERLSQRKNALLKTTTKNVLLHKIERLGVRQRKNALLKTKSNDVLLHKTERLRVR